MLIGICSLTASPIAVLNLDAFGPTKSPVGHISTSNFPFGPITLEVILDELDKLFDPPASIMDEESSLTKPAAGENKKPAGARRGEAEPGARRGEAGGV